MPNWVVELTALGAVADLDRVKVVVGVVLPAAVLGLPQGQRREPLLHVAVVGQPLAAVVLDVGGVLPLGGVLVQRGAERGGVAALGDVQLHRAARVPDGLRPGPDVGLVAVGDAVQLDVVHAPPGELVDGGVDERLGAGLGVVDAHHAAAVVVVLPGRGGDAVGGVLGAQDRGVPGHGLLGDAGRHVDAELQSEVVHVARDRRDAALAVRAGREPVGAHDPPAELVDVRALLARALVPEVVLVDVPVAEPLQAAVVHRAGGRLDDGGVVGVPEEAPAAPAQHGLEIGAGRRVYLGLGRGRTRQDRDRGGRGGQRHGQQRGGQAPCQSAHESSLIEM